MSALSIQKKINSANKKVANILGFEFTVYRPVTLMTPVKLSNFHSTQNGSFTLSDKFNKGITQGFDVYEVYTDCTDILSGDIFVHADETYVIMQSVALQPVQAFLSNRTITISRAGYSTAGNSFGKSETIIAQTVPASVQYLNSPDINQIPASTTNKSAIPAWEIFVHAADGAIKLNDIILDNQGNRSMVLAAAWSPLGYKLKTLELKKGV